LWLVPFLVLLEVRWWLIGSYLVADAAIGVGVFRYFYSMGSGTSVEVMENIVQFGVWGRASLLIVLFFVFLWAWPRGYRARSRPASRSDPRNLVPVV
jgi:membrane protein implicated in regulation of membrane protease activity